MDGAPLRILHIPEDAADGCAVFIPGAGSSEDACDMEERPHSLAERRLEDMHEWRCGDCNQPNEPEWCRCSMCGQLREDCEI